MEDQQNEKPSSDKEPLYNASFSIKRRHFVGVLTGISFMGILTALGIPIFALANSKKGKTMMSNKNTIVITTPRGDIGSQVLENILGKGFPVRAIDYKPQKLADNIKKQVEIFPGSHSEADVVSKAFEGAGSLFWLCPPDSKAPNVMDAYLGFTKAAAEAIKAHGIKRVVTVSALGRGTPMAENAGYVTASLAMEDMLAKTGVHLRTLNMPSFMDNIGRQAHPIKNEGVFYGAIDGDLKMPSVATRDIAAVASKFLIDPTWSGQEGVPVLGPEDISFNDMAVIMSEVLGKPVRYQHISFADYKDYFVELGFSDAMAQGMTDMARAKNEGMDKAITRTTDNTTPTTFREWCEYELKPLVQAVGE